MSVGDVKSEPRQFVRLTRAARSSAELDEAMAGFGGDAADDSNSVFLGDDTSQQPLLTTPQQA